MRLVPRALLACLILLVLPGLARAQDVATWYPTPDGIPLQGGLAVDADGTVFYGLGPFFGDPSIGELDPATGSTTLHAAYTNAEESNSRQVRDVAVDRVNGRVYYTKSTGLAVVADRAFSNQSGSFVTSKVDLGDIAVSGNGAWFAENGAYNGGGVFTGMRMAYISAQGSVSEQPVISDQSIRYDPKPKGVTIAPDGSTWFTQASNGNPGYRIAKVAGGGYQERSLLCLAESPCSGSNTGTGPTSIAAAPDGTLWFTNQLTKAFGRFDPATSQMTEYPLSALGLTGGTPQTVRTAPDGAIWLTVRQPNAAVRIVPQTVAGTDPTATVTQLGAAYPPLSLGVGPDGAVWVGAYDNLNNKSFVGRLGGTAGTVPPTGGGGDDTPPGGGGGGGTPVTPISLPSATTPPIVVAPSRSGTSKVEDPKVKGDSVRLTQICVGPPADKCSLVYLLDSHEYVTGFPGTKASIAKKKRKTRRVVVGKQTVTLSGGQSKTVTIKLNKAGKRIVRRDGKLNARLVVQEQRGSKLKTVKTKKLRFRTAKKR